MPNIQFQKLVAFMKQNYNKEDRRKVVSELDVVDGQKRRLSNTLSPKKQKQD